LRRLTRRWITLAESRGSEGETFGPPASPGRESARGQQHGGKAWSVVKALMAPSRKARVIRRRPDCLKPSSQRWKCASSDIQRPERSHQHQANPLCFAPTFRLVGGGQRAHSRERTGRLRHARYVQRKRNSGSPKGREAYGDGVPVVVVGVTPHQGERESRSHGRSGTGVHDHPEEVGYA
jgi:hypothetical protein